MTVPAPTNPNPDDGGAGGSNPPTPPAPTPPADPGKGGDAFNPEALTSDQINQILEKNPHIWKADRIAELREKSKKYDDAQAAATAAENKALEEQGKFKELADKQASENEKLRGQLKESSINAALTTKLAPLGVVDLEGALKLIDRSKVEVKDDGTIDGIDAAVEALKTDKAYLFTGTPGGTAPKVGSPTNPGNGSGTGTPKFKASQLRGPEGAKFYQENRKEILEAQAAGLIEQD